MLIQKDVQNNYTILLKNTITILLLTTNNAMIINSRVGEQLKH